MCIFCATVIVTPVVILRQGYQVSVKEVDALLSLLSEKKRKLEQEEAERNMQNLLDFLHFLRKKKIDELNEVCFFFFEFRYFFLNFGIFICKGFSFMVELLVKLLSLGNFCNVRIKDHK